MKQKKQLASGRLPLRRLQIFSVAARHGSFKKAAEELCVTPQAVSLQVRSLEESLQFELFVRLPAGIQLTAEGGQLLDYVERGVNLIETGIADIRAKQGRRQFNIRVSPWFAVHCLLPGFSEFEALYPQVDFNVRTALRFPDFSREDIDVAIQWGFGQWPFSHKQSLIRDDKCLVCAPELVKRKPLLQPRDLLQQRLLCTELSVYLWQQVLEHFDLDTVVERQAMPLDSQASQIEATLQGLGVALMSEDVAREYVASGDLIQPLGDWTVSQLDPALMPGYWLIASEGLDDPHSDTLIADFIRWQQQQLQTNSLVKHRITVE